MVSFAPNKVLGRWVAASVVVVIVAFGGLSVAAVQMARQAQWWVSHSQTVIAESSALLASMVDAETGERGFIITGDDSYLQPYREAQVNVPLHLGRLNELVADNPTQRTRLAQIGGLIQAKLSQMARAVDARGQGRAEVIDQAMMDALRLSEQAFVREENDLFSIRAATLDERYNLILGYCGLFALLTAAMAGFGVRKYGQIEQLASSAALEGQLRQSIESAPAGIAMFDRNMRYLAASRRFAEEFRIEMEGLVGRSHYEVFPEIPEKWREIHRHCLDGATERCAEEPFPRADGAIDWVSWEIRPWRDAGGAVAGIVLFTETITRRKQAEEALRESEAKFRLLGDAIPQLAWVAHPDGYIYWYNARWYEYTGTTPDQMEGWGWKRVHDENALPSVLERWSASIATGKPFDMTFPLRGADGQFRPFLTRVMPVLDREGQVIQWFGTNTDISEQKALEDALRQAKDESERALAEAERANLAKSKFLAAASHDLRQPVQSLVLLLAAIRPQANTERGTMVVDMMESALDGLNGLLASILDVSRIDAGVVIPQMQSLDTSGMLHRLWDGYVPECGQKNLTLRLHCKPGLKARTDAALLERILRNLIENAIRYTDRGGLLIGAFRRGDRLRIDIVDSGIGIPADKLAHIFEEFYQVANPARDQKQGLGLGLAIVRRLTRLIGADVQVRSREGRGTRFTVTVPVDNAVHEVSIPSASAAVVTGRRMMVIEDNPTIRKGLELLLNSWNCEAVGAESGEEALALGEREGWRFDVIIADHRLGAGMSGTQTAIEIGKRAGRPIPTLIVTGDTAPERISEVHASGFEMMHKPVTPDELARRMARLLRGGG